MAESLKNKYAIEVESGHPGFTNYKIISTPAGFDTMLSELQRKVEVIRKRTESDQQFRISRQLLWNGNATLVPGRTSRIYLSFEIDGDLEKYHYKTFRETVLFEYLMLGILAGVLIFAGIGLYSVINFLI